MIAIAILAVVLANPELALYGLIFAAMTGISIGLLVLICCLFLPPFLHLGRWLIRPGTQATLEGLGV
jgi:hypothetical protein